MIKRLLIIFFVLIVSSVAIVKIANRDLIKNSDKLQITTSIYPMYFFASMIGGEKINVNNITPTGAEPHDYDLTPQDVIEIQKSRLLILNGSIEPWGNKIKNNLNGSNTQILIAGENLDGQKIKEEGQMVTDPHIWLSPKLAKVESERIADELIKIDPSNSDYYKNNLNNLEVELDKLDSSYKNGLANCTIRDFVTSHAAFGYLANDYGLNQISVSGLTPDAEPSLSQLAQISDFAKKNNVKVIFFEALVSPKLSQTIADEVGAKTMVLDPIEGVSAQNLSKGINYLTLMANNLQNLRTALQCK